jgi:mycofactocin precursor
MDEQAALTVTRQPETAEARRGTDGDDRGADRLVEEDLLVEEVSIDGMCGVY